MTLIKNWTEEIVKIDQQAVPFWKSSQPLTSDPMTQSDWSHDPWDQPARLLFMLTPVWSRPSTFCFSQLVASCSERFQVKYCNWGHWLLLSLICFIDLYYTGVSSCGFLIGKDYLYSCQIIGLIVKRTLLFNWLAPSLDLVIFCHFVFMTKPGQPAHLLLYKLGFFSEQASPKAHHFLSPCVCMTMTGYYHHYDCALLCVQILTLRGYYGV